MNKTRDSKIAILTALKIITAIFYVIVTAVLLYGLIDLLVAPSENFSFALGLYLAIIVIILGFIGYIITLVPAVIGLIYSIVKKSGKANVIYFLVFSLLPILTEATFIIVCKLL